MKYFIKEQLPIYFKALNDDCLSKLICYVINSVEHNKINLSTYIVNYHLSYID